MNGLDGINSLKTALGGVNDAPAVAATQARERTAGADKRATQITSSADRASFSVAGGLAAQATDTSDVRLTKVAELRQAIASGTYNVPAAAVADKMVEGLLG